jgi:N6-adenosine-specific RNA methylase IME4
MDIQTARRGDVVMVTKSDRDLPEIVSALQATPVRTGSTWRANCPACPDNVDTSSVVILRRQDGTMLAHCGRGCTDAEIRRAVFGGVGPETSASVADIDPPAVTATGTDQRSEIVVQTVDIEPAPVIVTGATFDRKTVRTWDRVQAIMPPLATAQRDALRASIATHGVQHVPVLILPDGRIIDGHHRWEASGGTAPVSVVDLPDAEALALAVSLHVGRRSMSPEQVHELHERLRADRDAQRATARALRASGQTQAQVGALVGVDRATVRRWEQVGSNVAMSHVSEDAGPAVTFTGATNTQTVPPSPVHPTTTATGPTDLRVTVQAPQRLVIADRISAGEPARQVAADFGISERRARQIAVQVSERNRPRDPVGDPGPIPPGPWRCIVIDPPWPVRKMERETFPHQGDALDYGTMTLDAIRDLPVPALVDARGAHVYLWVTQSTLRDGLALFDAWGVRHECLMTWCKPSGLSPFSWMYDSEHVLFGRAGDGLPLVTMGQRLTFHAPTSGHSIKPSVFYDRVRLASAGPRLDLFGRQDRDGFTVWGDQSPKALAPARTGAVISTGALS